MSASLHFLTLVRLGTLLKSVKHNLLPKYMLDIPLVNFTPEKRQNLRQHCQKFIIMLQFGVKCYQNKLQITSKDPS